MAKWFEFSPPARRFLLFVWIACSLLPFSGLVINRELARQPSTELVSYGGTVGPWRGTFDANGYHHPDEAPDYVYRPGDFVVWESNVTVARGSDVRGRIELVCDDKIIWTGETHMPATEVRAGWKARGIRVPNGAPDGECAVARAYDITEPDGRAEHRVSQPIRIRIKA